MYSSGDTTSLGTSSAAWANTYTTQIDCSTVNSSSTLTITSGSTMYINKPTTASILFCSGGASSTYEKVRINTNGML